MNDGQISPTPEQTEIIESSDSRFVVRASAGAGKTFVLSERYLRYVDQGIPPDAILTVTFTNKAAAEMKRRIVRALRAKGLIREAQVAETGPIQTLHSFCERLLRENALAAGLDPEFEILAGAQDSHLVSSCVREALALDYEGDRDVEAILSAIGYGSAGHRSASPYSAMETSVAAVLEELRASAYDREEIESWYANPAALALRSYQVIASKLPEDIRSQLRPLRDSNLKECLADAFAALDIKVPKWLYDASQEEEPACLQQTCGLVKIACAAWHIFDRAVERAQALDFTELERRGVRLLGSSLETRKQTRDRYKVLMVDEAQDLNPIQFRLLRQLDLQEEILIGDHQQSIYSFRMADVSLFRGRMDEGPTKLIAKNHRSAPGVLEFVDAIFENVWPGEYQPMGKRDQVIDFEDTSIVQIDGVELWQHERHDVAAIAKAVAALIAGGENPKDIAILVRSGAYGQKLEMKLTELGIECRVVGGSESYYTRLEVYDLANTLRALADPTDDFALLCCLRSPVVGLTLDSIVMLSQHRPLSDALAEFVAPIPEDRERLQRFLAWFEPFRKYADRLPAWEVLAEVFAKSDYLAELAKRHNSKQLLSNARKLLKLATEEQVMGPLEYAERIREVQALRHREGDAPISGEDVVSIMTIHKAKGLEFPVVVVAETAARLFKAPKSHIVDGRTGLAAIKHAKSPAVIYSFLAAHKRMLEGEEARRLLYVALTRARRRLIVCLEPKNNYESLAKIVRDSMKTIEARIIARKLGQKPEETQVS